MNAKLIMEGMVVITAGIGILYLIFTVDVGQNWAGTAELNAKEQSKYIEFNCTDSGGIIIYRGRFNLDELGEIRKLCICNNEVG